MGRIAIGGSVGAITASFTGGNPLQSFAHSALMAGIAYQFNDMNGLVSTFGGPNSAYAKAASDAEMEYYESLQVDEQGCAMQPSWDEKVEILQQQINQLIEYSQVEETLNASPWHPLMWEKDVIWWASCTWCWGGDKFLAPWGHPFFPEENVDHH